MSANFSLHDYQEKAIGNVFADWRDYTRVLLMAAVGTGKTIMYLAVIDRVLRLDPRARIMVVVHMDHLVKQPIERIGSFFPHLLMKVGVVKAEQNQVASQIIVATVQTLNSANRMQDIKRHGDIDYIIYDECHHIVSDTAVRVIETFPNAKLLGCTATPKRTDNVSLGEIFEKVSYKLTIQDAIKLGALVPFTPFGFSLPLVVPDNWKIKEDGDDPKMGKLLSADNILEIVFNKWHEYAGDRLSIFFTASVAQAYLYADYFNAMGIPAAAADGNTPLHERDRILKSLASGEIRAAFNCQLWVEGMDIPELSCGGMIAPTRSDLTYVQRMGRVLRTFPNKTDAIILDFAPTGARDIVMATDVLEGVPRRVTEQREKAEQQGVLFSGFAVNKMGEVGFIDPHDVTAKVLSFLGKNKLAWTFDGKAASATVNQSTTLMILMPDRDRIEKADEIRREKGLNDKQKAVLDWISQYRVYSVTKRMGENQKGSDTRLETVASTIDEAKTFCESAFEPDGLGLKRKPWRDGPMSDKQAELLKRIGGFKPNLTKGQAAQQITHSLAFKAVQGMETAKQEQVFRQVAK